MHSNKRYTNVTISKRVDYDGGAHRGPRAKKEPLVCEHCGAVYSKRRWVTATDPRAALLSASAEKAICPACDLEAKGLARGYLRLEGAFVAGHTDALTRLLKNEATRAADVNPLGRIIGWETSEPGVLTVATSTEHLVERLGHALKGAFGGTMDYGFSHGNKFARGSWRKDD
jgi:hypothetical protein